jgi:hypothetical protein
MNRKKTSFGILIMAAIALVSLLLTGCRTTPAEQSSERVAEATQAQPLAFGRTLSSGTGAPLSDYFVAPQSIQDLINRYDVAFTGTIAAVGDPVSERPYNADPELDAHLESRGLPPLRYRVTYYDIRLEDIYLNDGNLEQYPSLRLFGDHNVMRPQVGERFLFVLVASQSGKSYGVNADWNLIHLDGGPIRNFDGKSTGYGGVADEASLKTATQSAVASRIYLPKDEWPVQQKWLTDENAPSGAPPSSGGDGETGPVGKASE